MELTHLVTILLKIVSSEPRMTPPMSMDLGSEEWFIGRIAMGPLLFFLLFIGDVEFNSYPHVVEDCTVIYSRATWHHWSGASVFNMRGQGKGDGGYTVTFRNIVVEDPRPTLQHFKILMEGVEPWSNPERKRGPGDLWGTTFENITIKAASVLEEPEVLWGMEDGLIRGLIFKNVTLAGEKIEGVEFFQTNEFVFN